MQSILNEIRVKQTEFKNLSFFKLLETSSCIEDASIFAPGLAFFVLTFQDILRLNEQQISSLELMPIIKHHRQEDLGHDIWFLHDLEQLGFNCHAALLFGERFTETRDASFEIVSEVFRASDDRVRLVIPLALEAAGHEFFSRVFHFFARTGFDGELRYFSQEHFQVEQAHEMFEQEIDTLILNIDMPKSLIDEARDVIERIFHALSKMVCAIQQKIDSQQRKLQVL